MRASEQAKRAGQGREEAARSMGLAADLAPVEILAVDLQTPTLRSYIATYVRLMAEFYRHVAASPPINSEETSVLTTSMLVRSVKSSKNVCSV